MLLDLLWPTLDRSSNESEQHKQQEQVRLIEDRVRNLPLSVDELKEHLDASERFRQDERTRRASIESRLQTSAGMVSLLGAVVLGPFLSFTVSKPATLAPTVMVLIVVGCAYLAMQLIAVLLAALRGLRASGYLADLPHEVIPTGDSNHAVFLRRRVRTALEQAHDDRWQNSRKLDQLAVAHRATLNFLFGLLIFVALTVSITVWNVAATDPPCPAGMRCTPQTQVADTVSGVGSPSQTPPSVPQASSAPNPSSAHSSDSSNPSPVGSAMRRYVLMFGASVLLISLGIVVMNTARSFRAQAAGAALIATGLLSAASLIGKLEVTGLKIDKILGELNVSWEGGTASPPVPTPTPPPNAVMQVALRRAVTIKPFGDGEHELDGASIRPCVAAALALYKDHVINGWVFVGRVDKRELSRERAGLYGSNQALAMARANWAAQQTAQAAPSKDLSSAIVTIGGAGRIGVGVKAEDLEADRAVDLFLMVSSTTRDGKTVPLPAATTCAPPAPNSAK